MKRADRRKYHYIYKTICLITDKYYIGMHSTDNLDDGYHGSGRILSKSVKKYGKDKHHVEILEFLPDRKSLREREREIVNEEIVNDKMCMNLALGGEGGLICIEAARRGAKLGGLAARKTLNERRKDKEWVTNVSKKISSGVKLAIKEGRLNTCTFKGKKHTQETKEKMSQKAKLRTGSKNSQFGTCWITNDTENKKIKKIQLKEYLNLGWVKGRKINFT